MRFEEIDSVDRHLQDALLEMYRGTRDALIVHNVFHPDALAEFVAHLEAHDGRYHWDLQESADPNQRQMRVLGRTLTPIAGDAFDLDAYMRIGEQTAQIIGQQLPAGLSRAEDIWRALSGGRPVHCPQVGGRRYGPATVRHLPVGCQIPVHCGLFFMETSGYRDLMGTLDSTTQLSWFVPLQNAESGGELVVYDLAWTDPDVPRVGDMYDPNAIESRPSVRVAPPVGSMLLFDGGRWFHKVSPIAGQRARWTLGGFLGFSREMDRVMYWS